MPDNNVNAIAIHLPQFHPFPENDAWWGKGFTEWTNVTKATPRFKDHYQPHLPADMGFYDLRLHETVIEQADLASQYGIKGFCFYHYWFNGKRLMEKPVDNLLRAKTPDFPFMLCWANENWTRRWDGMDSEVLIQQDYSPEDDVEHIRFLLQHHFADPRYITVDDKPFILIYRPALFPDIRRTLDCWRREAEAAGFKGLYIGYMQSFGFRESPAQYGFDCAVEFQPDFTLAPGVFPSVKEKILHRLGLHSSVHYSDALYSYTGYVQRLIEKGVSFPGVYQSVCPMWDNSSRRQKGASIFTDSTPEAYKKWLQYAVEKTRKAVNPGNFLFINAWNEWAEGNHLEPCRKWGHAYLEATKEVLEHA